MINDTIYKFAVEIAVMYQQKLDRVVGMPFYLNLPHPSLQFILALGTQSTVFTGGCECCDRNTKFVPKC